MNFCQQPKFWIAILVLLLIFLVLNYEKDDNPFEYPYRGQFRDLSSEDLAESLGINKSLKIGDMYKSHFDDSPSVLCEERGKNLKVFLAVVSSVQNFKNRDAIRRTWGNLTDHEGIEIGFFLGISKDHGLQDQIKKENEAHGDLVQAEFLDDFSNLPLKVISILNWANTKCHRVKFILKVDDDVFLNVPNLLDFLEEHKKDSNSIYGCLESNIEPARFIKSNCYVSKQEFPAEVYPDYVGGPAYLMTNDFVPDFVELVTKAPFFHIEDIFITGFMANLTMNVQLVNVPEFRLVGHGQVLNLCLMKTSTIAWHYFYPDELVKMWPDFEKLNTTKCK